jgi:hypothetical protein
MQNPRAHIERRAAFERRERRADKPLTPRGVIRSEPFPGKSHWMSPEEELAWFERILERGLNQDGNHSRRGCARPQRRVSGPCVTGRLR